MKDEALRRSIMIVAKSYLSRSDAPGEAIHRILMSILDGAEVLDEVFADNPTRRKK